MLLPVTLVVSEEPFLRLGLRIYGLTKMHFPACHEARTVEEAIAILADQPVELVLVGACAKHEQTPRWVESITRHRPKVPVIVVCQEPSPDQVRRVLQVGAMGVITNLDSKEELRRAVAAALSGARHVSGRASGSLIAALEDVHVPAEAMGLGKLSRREKEVFELMGAHRSTKDIAAQLGIGEKTVETHKYRIKTKLHLDHTSQVKQAAVAAHTLTSTSHAPALRIPHPLRPPAGKW